MEEYCREGIVGIGIVGRSIVEKQQTGHLLPRLRPLCGCLACTGRAKLHTQSPTETVRYSHYTPTDKVHYYVLATAIHSNPLQCIVSLDLDVLDTCVSLVVGRVAASIEGEEQIEHGC